MESTVMNLELENGAIIRVQAEIPEDTIEGEKGLVDLNKLLPFKEVTNTIEDISDAIVKSLRNIQPDKATIEFGITIGVESGALTTLLVKGSGEGFIKVALEWDMKE